MLIDPCELSPSYVRSIAPYQPGKLISELARELGLDQCSIIKLASNENPRGIGPRTRAAIDAALGDIARYPDGNGFELKQALAARYGVDMSAIVLGNGSNDVLELAALAFLGPGRAAVMSQHAFAVYPLATPLRICGEVELRVQQNLLGKGELKDVRRVYSHAQSLGQCNAWLAQHLPGAERLPLGSNAEAAQRAASEPGAAAIAGEAAAERYGLQVLARAIEDAPNNTTRFLVLGELDAAPTGKDRTSLVMSAENKPGAVHALLTPLAEHKVSMTRIESRPARSRSALWEYVFFVDVEGHQKDAPLAAALRELRAKAPFLKVLGSYPIAK